jgi:hypothetical protein
MIGFCVDPPQENDLSDVDTVRKSWRNKKTIVPDHVARFIDSIESFDNSVIITTECVRENGPAFMTKKMLHMQDFTFLEPDFSDRTLRQNGELCPKLYQLFISASTLRRLFHNADVKESKRITCNMLHPLSILYVVQDAGIIINKHQLDRTMSTLSTTIVTFNKLIVFEIDTLPPGPDQSLLLILPPAANVFIEDQKVMCNRQGNRVANIDIDHVTLKQKYDLEYLESGFNYVSPRQEHVPLSARQHIIYNFYSPYFKTVASLLPKTELIIFGDSYPYSTTYKPWNEELAVVNYLVELCKDYGAVVMTSTLYMHEEENTMQHLTDIVNQTVFFYNPVTEKHVYNVCVAELVQYSPTDNGIYSVLVRKSDIRQTIAFDVLSSPLTTSKTTDTFLTSVWHVRRKLDEHRVILDALPPLPRIDAFAKYGTEYIKVTNTTIDEDKITITYSITLEPKDYTIVFGLRVGNVTLNVELMQRVHVLAAAVGNDGDDGGSRLFRSGKLLDMMLQ